MSFGPCRFEPYNGRLCALEGSKGPINRLDGRYRSAETLFRPFDRLSRATTFFRKKSKKIYKSRKKSDFVGFGLFIALVLLGSCSEAKFDQIRLFRLFRVFPVSPHLPPGWNFARIRGFKGRLPNAKRSIAGNLLVARATWRSQ